MDPDAAERITESMADRSTTRPTPAALKRSSSNCSDSSSDHNQSFIPTGTGRDTDMGVCEQHQLETGGGLLIKISPNETFSISLIPPISSSTTGRGGIKSITENPPNHDIPIHADRHLILDYLNYTLLYPDYQILTRLIIHDKSLFSFFKHHHDDYDDDDDDDDDLDINNDLNDDDEDDDDEEEEEEEEDDDDDDNDGLDINNDLATIRSCSSMDLFDTFLAFVSSRSIKEIQLKFHHPFPTTCDNPTIPPSLFHSFQTLTSLELTSLCFPQLPNNFQGFPLLETLHLRYALFGDSHELARLLSPSSCPLLKSLIIHKSHWIPNVTVTPRIFPNLIKFKFVDHLEYSPQNLYIEEAPNLRLFYFCGAIEKLNLMNCPNLHAAHISSSARGLLSCKRLMDIVKVLTNVKLLVVGFWFFPHFTHWHWQTDKVYFCRDSHLCGLRNYPVPFLENLTEFHCHGILLNKLTMRALLVFICRNPSLEKLCINLDFYKPQLPEPEEREKMNAEFSANNSSEDIMDDYGDQLKRYRNNQEVFARLEEEKKLLCHSENLKLRLKYVTLTQFSDDQICTRMLRFILEKSPHLMSLHVNCLLQNQITLAVFKQEILSFTRLSESVNIKVKGIEVSDYFSKCRGKCSPVDSLWSNY